MSRRDCSVALLQEIRRMRFAKISLICYRLWLLDPTRRYASAYLWVASNNFPTDIIYSRPSIPDEARVRMTSRVSTWRTRTAAAARDSNYEIGTLWYKRTAPASTGTCWTTVVNVIPPTSVEFKIRTPNSEALQVVDVTLLLYNFSSRFSIHCWVIILLFWHKLKYT